MCKKGSFSSLGTGKDQCCFLCDSDTFSALDGASECNACDTSANLFSSKGASYCTHYSCGKACADSVGVDQDCGNDCLAGDCYFIGIVVGEEAQRVCEEKKTAAACFSGNKRMLLSSATFNSTLPVSVTKSATNPFGPNLIALDVLFLPSDSSPVSPTEARQRFIAAAANGMLGGSISAVKIGDTIVNQRVPPSTAPSLAQDGSVVTFPLWATIFNSASAAVVIIGTALLRNDRILFKKFVNLMKKSHPVQRDVTADECGQCKSARIVIEDLHAAAESNISSDIGSIPNCVASAASCERDPRILHASQEPVFHPRPPTAAPMNPSRIRSTKIPHPSSSETVQVETSLDSNGLVPRRRLQHSSASRYQVAAPLRSFSSQNLMRM